MSEPWWYWLLVVLACLACARCGWLLWRQRRWSIRHHELVARAHARLVEDVLWTSRRRSEYELALTLRAHRLATTVPVPLRLIHTTVGEL